MRPAAVIVLAAGAGSRMASRSRRCCTGCAARPFDSNWDVWVFSLPSDSVRLSDSERWLIGARRLDGSAGLTDVVSRFLLDLARHSETCPPSSPNESWPTPATWS